MLRFGIVGAGNIARTHAAAIRASKKAELVAVSGGQAAREFAEQEDARYYADVAELNRDPRLDAVILCTPSGVRRDYAVDAASQGKHVLVEKPIEVSLSRAHAIMDACEENGVTLGVVYQSRYKPHCTALHNALGRGALGEVVLGDAYVKWHRPQEYYHDSGWRGTWEFDGGGALMNQAIHTVDLLLWFLGDVRSVSARCANRLHEGIEVEDTVVAQLEFVDGALGVIEATTAAYPGSPRRIEVHGTNGTVVLVDDVVSEWELRDGSPAPALPGAGVEAGTQSTHVLADYSCHQLQIEDFVDAVEEGRAPLIDGNAGIRSLALVLAIYESARTGRRIEMSGFGRPVESR